jgi:hypothetical protein
MVAHVYNPSYEGGRDVRIMGQGQLGNKVSKTLSQKKKKKKPQQQQGECGGAHQ